MRHPGLAQSNGLAERSRKTVKHLFKKANSDLFLALLTVRNTSITGMDH